MAQPWHRTYEYQQARALLLAADDLCRLCGHHGADTADHIISPLFGGVWRGSVEAVLGNLQPAHGVHGCPTCRIACNQTKGAAPATTTAPLRTSEPW